MKVPSAPRPLEVFFFIHHLSGGGAERVVVRLVRALDRGRFRPSLVLFERRGEYLGAVPEDVPILDCARYGAGGRWRWFFTFVGFLRHRRPDVVVSFLWFPSALAVIGRFFAGTRCGLIVSERLTVEGSQEGLLTEWLRRLVIRVLYPWADRVVPNSEATAVQLCRRFSLPREKVIPLANPFDLEEIRGQAQGGKPSASDAAPAVVAMGRLTRQKGFDLLLRALPRAQRPFQLCLLGQGPEEASLRALGGALGCADRVEFAGFLENPYPRLLRASVFVLSSRYEGFPNALVEAMALGLPCVATRCPTGPEEIITDGVDGLLVPVEDPDALAAAIDRLLADPALRARLGEAAARRARDFDLPVVVRQFEALFEEVAG